MSKKDEISVHDKWASGVNPQDVNVYACMEGVNAVESRYLMSRIKQRFKSFEGLRVLDVGCGLGESAVYIALLGAHVTALDLSHEMVCHCRRLAQRHSVEQRMDFVTGCIDDAPRGRQYDVVFCANVLHHVVDLENFLCVSKGLMKEKGMFLSWDPIDGNPAIKLYRKMAENVRTSGEKPLNLKDISLFQDNFSCVDHREFWFFAQIIFLKYYLVDRLDPGSCRYWKKIYDDQGMTAKLVMKLLHCLDRIPLSLPLIRRWAWNMCLVATK